MASRTEIFSIEAAEGGGFLVQKDGRPLMTPRKKSLMVPTIALAEAVVDEFAQQGEKRDLRTMPLTQMALTSLDVTMGAFSECVDDVMRYGACELVCQRATDPVDLVEKQNNVWQPYLDWCASTLNANLSVGSGILPVAQSPEALAALRIVVAAQTPFSLTGLKEASHTFGSLVLGVALLMGHASATEAFEAAELDCLWQLKRWGDDADTQKRLDKVNADAAMCATWFTLLGT